MSKLHRYVAFFSVAVASALWLVKPSDAQQFQQYPKVKVSAETSIDWMYPLLRSSPTEAPAGLLDGYVSTRQRYDLFAPEPQAVRGEAMPLVLFISYRSTPIGWSVFGPTCVRRGVMFAEPPNAGNSTPMTERVRIVLDVLDDLRRRYTIDPDRTYIAGYSGGGTTASLIASALPEFFGGVVASNTVVPIPRTPSRLEQLRNRLSIVMFAGEREPKGRQLRDTQSFPINTLRIRADGEENDRRFLKQVSRIQFGHGTNWKNIARRKKADRAAK